MFGKFYNCIAPCWEIKKKSGFTNNYIEILFLWCLLCVKFVNHKYLIFSFIRLGNKLFRRPKTGWRKPVLLIIVRGLHTLNVCIYAQRADADIIFAWSTRVWWSADAIYVTNGNGRLSCVPLQISVRLRV